MAFEHRGARAPDLLSCRYGGSRLLFRGPPARLDAPYIAALGGAETYAGHVADPWPSILGRKMGLGVANLAASHAGPDFWLGDPALLAVAAGARLRVMQVTGAINVTNPFYSVHPRRNDRFLAETPALRRLYPEVDFTEFHFTRHLTYGLCRRDPGRFAEVAAALAATWEARMRTLLEAIGGPTVLVVIGDAPGTVPRLGSQPPLVTAGMVEALRGAVTGIVVVPCPPDGAAGIPMAAVGQPGPAAHAAIAAALAAAVPP